MSTELFLTLLVVFWLVLLLVSRGRVGGKGQASRGSARPLAASDEDLWLQKLLAVTLNNRGAIERGVTAKRRSFPHASRAELLERVHTDYMRDRH